jgi:chemotaxis protein MotB
MTSLAVIFILLLVLLIAHYSRQIAVLKEQIQRVQSVKDELKSELEKKGYKAEDDPRDVLAIVYHAQSEKLQFDVDKADMKEAGQTFLRDFIPRLVDVIGEKKFLTNVESILIEGHTDSDGDDEHNLKLSQDRSFAVLKFGLNGCGLNPRNREHFLYLTSISGRGKRGLLPLGARPGFENKTRSRRVEFVIRLKSFEQHADARSLLNEESKSGEGAKVVPGSARPMPAPAGRAPLL